MRPNQQERGFALVGAVFALVVIASLIAGAFFASMQEISIGRSSQSYQKALDAAEGGSAIRIANWAGQAGTLNNLAVGDSATYTDTLPDGRSTATSYVRRLSPMMYLIRTVGGSGTSQRVIGSLVKMQLVNLNMKASLTTRASLKLGGSSFIDGRNTSPLGWGCPPAFDTLAAVRTHDSTLISYSGCSHMSCIFGKPDIMQDTTLKDSTFTSFGGMSYWDLAAAANITFNGNTGPLNNMAADGTISTCNTANIYNWGDPYRPGTVLGCDGYFPIIHIAGTTTVVNGVTTVTNGTGNLQLTGGYGQGILLVDGDLSVQGGFEFFGPVIVLGHVTTAGTGGHFNGGLMAADVNLELNTVLGNAVVTYSSCAISRALNGSSSGRFMKERRWVDLTQ
jgi:hypothetical protein